jgi:putative membrane protein
MSEPAALAVSPLSPPRWIRSPVSGHGQPGAMNPHVKLGAVLAVAALALTPAAARAASTYSPLDEQILQSSIQGDRFEIIGGKVAETKGASARTRALGARLVKDHSKSLREAVALARHLGIKVPSTPSTTEEWELSVVSALSGSDFDIAYSSLEVQDHKQDIEDVHAEQEGGLNKLVIALEHKDLPTLRFHLQLSKKAFWAATGH